MTWEKREEMRTKTTTRGEWESSDTAGQGIHACVNVLANVNSGEKPGNEPDRIPEQAFV